MYTNPFKSILVSFFLPILFDESQSFIHFRHSNPCGIETDSNFSFGLAFIYFTSFSSETDRCAMDKK